MARSRPTVEELQEVARRNRETAAELEELIKRLELDDHEEETATDGT